MTSKNLSPEPVQITLTFGKAMEEVLAGKKVTRLEWNNPEIYLVLMDSKLKIKTYDGLFHDLIVSDGDLAGIDWVTI